MESEKKMLTLNEVSQILNAHYMTVRNEILRGRLKAFKVGKDYRIDPLDLESYIKDNEVQTNGGDSGSNLS